jgi:hypothetical protein
MVNPPVFVVTGVLFPTISALDWKKQPNVLKITERRIHL